MDQDIVNLQSTATDWMFCPTPTPAIQSPFTPHCPKCSCNINKASTFTGPSLLLISILFQCISVLIQTRLITQLNLKKLVTLLIMDISVRDFRLLCTLFHCQPELQSSVYKEFQTMNLNLIKYVYMIKVFWEHLRSYTDQSTKLSLLCFNLQISSVHKGCVCASLWTFAICML